MNAAPKRRLFVGIELDDRIRNEIEDLVRPWRSLDGFRWVPAENLHLTLAFLGWVEVSTVDAIVDRLPTAAARPHAFSTRLSGAGRFPERGKARVLWVGLDDAGGALTALAETVQGSLQDSFQREDRPYRPHITVARARRPVAVPGLETGGGSSSFDVDEIALFESHLGRQHARYEVLARSQLGARPPSIS
jgi:2'-5' RNA ligase